MCVCVCVCEHTSLLCPASHPEETPPHASGPSLHITGQLCIDSQARQPVVGLGVGEGTQTPPSPPQKTGQTRKVPPEAGPLTHRSGYCWGNWHLLPRLGNRCRRRQKCAAYSFLHWRKRSPGPIIDLVFPPFPLFLSLLLPVLFLLPFLPSSLASCLPSARFVCFPWNPSA